MKRSPRILVALEAVSQRVKAVKILEEQGFGVLQAEDLAAFDAAKVDADAVLIDVDFAGGAVADWLLLWPVPVVLVANSDENPRRLANLYADEASSFVLRDVEDRWYGHIPPLLHKAIAIRESLDRRNSNIIRAESSYQNLLRVIPDIVYVLDGDGCFTYLNDAVTQLGWKPAELVGRHFAEIVHPDDFPEVSRILVLNRCHGQITGPESAPKLFDERRTGDRRTKDLVVRLRHKYHCEWTTKRVDSWGEVAALGVNLPEFQSQGIGTVGVIRDISERRQNEREMRLKLESKDLHIKEIHHRAKNNL
ncbi:MAG: PAS domain S-box protein, partial [Spirochaetales bacterium]